MVVWWHRLCGEPRTGSLNPERGDFGSSHPPCLRVPGLAFLTPKARPSTSLPLKAPFTLESSLPVPERRRIETEIT